MPLTIHAAWLRKNQPFPTGQLFIWAEDPIPDLSIGTTPHGTASSGDADPTALGSPDPGNGRARSIKIPSHPVQVPIGALRTLLIELLPDPVAKLGTPASTTVWLPSQDSGPLARQSHFQRRNGAGNGKTDNADLQTSPDLTPWQIAGLTLPPVAALGLLTSLDTHQATASTQLSPTLRHMRLGTDLLFWSNGAKLVLEILAGQHFLPGLLPVGPAHFEAIWRPSLMESTIYHRVARWIRIMPALCRAYDLAQPADAPPRADLADHFITSLLDATVRAWVAHPETTLPLPSSSGTQWVRALTNEHPQLPLPPKPAHQLYQEWRAWTDQLYATNDANFRICLKLEEPAGVDEGERSWTLRYLLQARDDAALQIPAAYVWQERSSTLRFHNRRFDQPQERLLAGLGIASRLFAPIKRSLRSTQPEQAQLSTEEAHLFLREIGPLLQSSGFGVITPEWWDPRNRASLGLRLRLSAPGEAQGDTRSKPRANRGGGKVRYGWDLTLGANPLDSASFDKLVDLHSPLIRIQNRWIELDPEQVAAARRFLADHAEGGTVNLLQAVRMAQGNLEDQLRIAGETQSQPMPPGAVQLPGLPLDAVALEGWVDEALGRLHHVDSMTALAEPAGFTGDLRPYQQRGLGWLWYLRQLGLGACLADDMGLGKTIQTIALFLHARQIAKLASAQNNGEDAYDQDAGPVLLICPTSVVSNWRR